MPTRNNNNKKERKISILEEVWIALSLRIMCDEDSGETLNVNEEDYLNIDELDELGGEDEDDLELGFGIFYRYRNPQTNELFLYDRTGLHRKDGQQLLYVGRAKKKQKPA